MSGLQKFRSKNHTHADWWLILLNLWLFWKYKQADEINFYLVILR